MTPIGAGSLFSLRVIGVETPEILGPNKDWFYMRVDNDLNHSSVSEATHFNASAPPLTIPASINLMYMNKLTLSHTFIRSRNNIQFSSSFITILQ
jgi:hypothetical protein